MPSDIINKPCCFTFQSFSRQFLHICSNTGPSVKLYETPGVVSLYWQNWLFIPTFSFQFLSVYLLMRESWKETIIWYLWWAVESFLKHKYTIANDYWFFKGWARPNFFLQNSHWFFSGIPYLSMYFLTVFYITYSTNLSDH